ncbi:MAG: polysaccharide deacetylase family protein [Ignavibacteriae bacterium]|nr:polysaccharide deacetylase family protein [Ignavibacteriota bacterium]
MGNIIFFRNDDLRNKLDDSLLKITDLFIKYEIPITHSVEPANVSEEVVNWLIDVKQKHPDLIEIMQHGYEHRNKNNNKKGEFGGQRGYDEQYKDISRGKALMDKYFGDLWFSAFNFPYGPYNPAAIKAVNDCRFKVLNSHYNARISRKIFYSIGHLLRKGYLFDHHISWNLDYYPGTNLFEIDMNVGFIKKYVNEQEESMMHSLEELIEDTKKYFNQKTIGVLIHHRYHNTPDKIAFIENYLKWCKDNPDFTFLSMSRIYERFK